MKNPNLFVRLPSIRKSDVIPGGLADNVPKSKFDQAALREGMRVEREHTSSAKIASEIARDHLTEDPQYYQKLKKVEKGDGEGSFRGGDPEEIEIKRKEKEEAMADSGIDADEDAEEPDPADVEEAELAEQDKQDLKGSLSKATTGPLGTIGSSQVSPIDTGADYAPRNTQGDQVDPHEGKPKHPEPWIEPGPPRQGENQHKLWSDVLQSRVPMVGSRAMHLRQWKLRGDVEGMQREEAMLAKAGYRDLDQEALDEAEKKKPQASQHRNLLAKIPEMGEDQLRQLAKTIWGDDFEYEEWADENYIREDVAGSVQDMIDSASADHLDQVRESASHALEW
jgi:hypothetical protein